MAMVANKSEDGQTATVATDFRLSPVGDSRSIKRCRPRNTSVEGAEAAAPASGSAINDDDVTNKMPARSQRTEWRGDHDVIAVQWLPGRSGCRRDCGRFGGPRFVVRSVST